MQEVLPATKIDHTRFVRDGFDGPFTVMPRDEAIERRTEVERVLGLGRVIRTHFGERHHDSEAVWRICSQPAVVDLASQLLGDDVVLWSTQFFVKEKGDAQIPWHQDGFFWELEPSVNVSVWVSLDESDETNGCLQVIPGSHRKIYTHVDATDEDAFRARANPDQFDPAAAHKIPTHPGQSIVFNERLLHHSSANLTDRRRLAMACRFTIPQVDMKKDRRPIVVKGSDRLGFNKYVPPPFPFP